MADQIIDPYKYLELIRKSDGTITRNPNRYPDSDPNQTDGQVLSKDLPINKSNNTWIRIFLPRKAIETSSTATLPLIVYFHGGGFIYGSAGSTIYHNFCSNMVIQHPVVIASVNYRLAPENRLPAAYEDAIEALEWLKTTNDEWLVKYADISNCFIMGSSSGGNIVYHLGLHLDRDLNPLKIRGLILHHPFFGGKEKTESELKLIDPPNVPPSVIDLMFSLALPIGVDYDHRYCNPTVDGETGAGLMKLKVLVTGVSGDPFVDRQRKLVKLMAEIGIDVVGHFSEGGYHIVELTDSSKALALFNVLKTFMSSSIRD